MHSIGAATVGRRVVVRGFSVAQRCYATRTILGIERYATHDIYVQVRAMIHVRRSSDPIERSFRRWL